MAYSFPDRQYDINRIFNDHVTLPIAIPYRLDATDYVFFNYDSTFPAHRYAVVVESPSNASPNPSDRFRVIGPLQQKVELPQVQFSRGGPSAAQIGVLPIYEDKNLSPYVGPLVRGSTYTISSNAKFLTTKGHRQLYRTGGVI